jgi:glyoxylase-like metal-dependent hydrolase (beta-lactamase superfamily II)
MHLSTHSTHVRRYMIGAIAGLALSIGVTSLWPGEPTAGAAAPSLAANAPRANMPSIAPIGVIVDRYADVPASAKGPVIDRVKGYRTERLGDGLYMLTDGGYQSMFMTYDDGVIVVDAPPSLSGHIRAAIAEVSDRPITHLIYSHFHADHIGGAALLGGHPVIIAHEDTNRLLARTHDPNRPLAAVTFSDRYRLLAGTQVLELSYHGNAHSPGNIFIHAPRQRTLMVVDVVFPGWMPWRRFALAQDVPGYFAQVKEIGEWDFDTLVGGHVARTGTRADVATQLAFMNDLKEATVTALSSFTPGDGLSPADLPNTWAVFDHYIDRVAAQCVTQLAPKWSERLAGFDVYAWDQCYAMEQSLRID